MQQWKSTWTDSTFSRKNPHLPQQIITLQIFLNFLNFPLTSLWEWAAHWHSNRWFVSSESLLLCTGTYDSIWNATLLHAHILIHTYNLSSRVSIHTRWVRDSKYTMFGGITDVWQKLSVSNMVRWNRSVWMRHGLSWTLKWGAHCVMFCNLIHKLLERRSFDPT